MEDAPLRALLLGLLGLASAGCTRPSPAPSPAPHAPAPTTLPGAVAPRLLPLGGLGDARNDASVDPRHAELSGLAWHGDELYLLPQYPERFGDRTVGSLLRLSRQRLDAFFDGQDTSELVPERVPFRPGPARELPGYEGFEALAFDGDRLWVTIEATVHHHTTGYLVRGDITPQGITLSGEVIPLPTPRNEPNTGFEALVVVPGGVLALYEANGLDPAPWALRAGDGGLARVPFPVVDFRVTDATETDGEGRFWVVNYLYPGDTFLLRGDAGPSRSVEALLELAPGPEGVRRTGRAVPLAVDARPRNWEGVARYRGGVLLVTDLWPRTLLAWVPVPARLARTERTSGRP
ncbi:MAG: hypothetical protein HY909_21245 [Deltaproteobacteria bacterium]|nr:hypothetical protein [Deltaproteobacteria bacterium]